MNVLVRPMQQADVGAVVVLAAALPQAPNWTPDVYEAALASPGRRIALVAEDESGVLAGFAVASLVGPESEFESIAVAPGFQRGGIGRLLLTDLMERAAGFGCAEMLLEVRAGNVAAQALYASVGFAVVGLRPGYYTNPVEDAVLMGRKIGQY